MKYVTSLLTGYPAQSPAERKLCLAQLARYEPDLELEDVRSLLGREVLGSDAAVVPHARAALASFLESYTAHTFRPALELLDASAPQDMVETRTTAAAELLAPGLLRLLESSDPSLTPWRAMGSVLLGCLGSPRVLDFLQSRISRDPPDELAAFALSEIGGTAAGEGVGAFVRKWSRDRPWLLMLLRSFPSAATAELLAELGEASGEEGRICAALTLSYVEGPEALAARSRLARGAGPMVARALLVSLLGREETDVLPLVLELQGLHPDPALQALALRAVADVPSPEVRELLVTSITSPHGNVAVAAMETWLARGGDPALLQTRARQALAAEDPTERFFGILALATIDPGAVTSCLKSLLVSPSVRARFAGAQILGYVRSSRGATLLEHMAVNDPSPAVRGESALSLSRHDPDQAWPALIGLITRADIETATRAARLLACLPAEMSGAMREVLTTAIPRRGPAEERGRLLPFLGACAARPGSPVPASLVDSLGSTEDALRIGSLRGLRWLGDRVPLEAIEPLGLDRDPRIRARAAHVQVLGGEISALEILSNMLGSGDPAQIQEALHPSLELGMLLSHPAHLVGFSRLEKALTAQAESSAAAPARPRAPKRPTRRTRPVMVALPSPAEGVAPPPDATTEHLGNLYQALGVRTAEPEPPPLPGEHSGVSSRLLLLESGRLRISGSGRHRPDVTEGKESPGKVALPVALIVIVLAAAVWMAQGEGSRSPASASAPGSSARHGGLSVLEIRGTCTRHRAGGVTGRLRVGDRVAVGDLLRLEGDAQLRLQDAGSGWVSMGPASEVEIVQPGPLPGGSVPPQLMFREPIGSCEMAFPQVPAIGIEVAGFVIRAEHAHLTWDLGKEGRRVGLKAGELGAHRDGKLVKQLVEGEEWVIP